MAGEADRRARVRAAIGRVGVWSFAFDRSSAAEEREALRQIEDMGWPVLWIPEGRRSKDAMAHSAILLGASERLVVATGIASIWARDPVAMATGAGTLDDAFPDRFLLGMGVSHRPNVEVRGVHTYARPYGRMRSYLEAMDETRYPGGRDRDRPPRVLAALGPRMLRLAAERAEGAHPYFVPVEHTRRAREILGPDPILAPEQAVTLESDPETARAIARAHTEEYLNLENYANNLRRLGWADEDMREGGSDRLVDAVVAWGGPDAIRARVHEHLDAGADHVSVQVLVDGPSRIPVQELRELAPVLLGT